MAANTYGIGRTVRVEVTFFDGSGNPVDPLGAVTCDVRTPTSGTETPTPVHDSTGVYHVDLAGSEWGLYYFDWVGRDVGEAGVDVSPTAHAVQFVT